MSHFLEIISRFVFILFYLLWYHPECAAWLLLKVLMLTKAFQNGKRQQNSFAKSSSTLALGVSPRIPGTYSVYFLGWPIPGFSVLRVLIRLELPFRFRSYWVRCGLRWGHPVRAPYISVETLLERGDDNSLKNKTFDSITCVLIWPNKILYTKVW